MTEHPEPAFAPSPAHRAIDLVSALTLRVQCLERDHPAPEAEAEAFRAIARDLADLAAILRVLLEAEAGGT